MWQKKNSKVLWVIFLCNGCIIQVIFIRFHFFSFFVHFCYASDTFINVVSKNDYFIYHQDSGKFLYLFWWKFHIVNGLARSSHELVNAYFLICLAFIPIFVLHFFFVHFFSFLLLLFFVFILPFRILSILCWMH